MKTEKEIINEFDEIFHERNVGCKECKISEYPIYEDIKKFVIRTNKEAVEEAFKAIEIEKMINTKEEDNSDWFMGFGYNHAIDEIEQKKKEYLDKLKDNQN